MRTVVTLAAAALVCTAMFSCSQEAPDVTDAGPSQSSTIAGTDTASITSTMNPVLPTEAQEPSSRAAAANPRQEVHLIEYAIRLPESVPAGRIAFNVENGGKEDHAFEIEGNGVHQKSTVLKRGDSAAVEVDLKPGTYTVYCPVKGHADKGMRTTLTVK